MTGESRDVIGVEEDRDEVSILKDVSLEELDRGVRDSMDLSERLGLRRTWSSVLRNTARFDDSRRRTIAPTPDEEDLE